MSRKMQMSEFFIAPFFTVLFSLLLCYALDMNIQKLKDEIISARQITKPEALALLNVDIEKLSKAANEIREYFCGCSFDVCSILNGKSGRCSENCKFCAQSIHYKTLIEEYPLIENKDELVKSANYNKHKGVLRLAIVTSGKKLNDEEFEIICQNYKTIASKCDIFLCASHGLLTCEQFKSLKIAGVKRYHCNIETSRNFFPYICTTHSYDDRINVIKNAQAADLEVCSGGILGLGESMEDRIDMAFTIRKLNIKSVPVNVLSPIKGTPLEFNKIVPYDEVRRTIAIFRFILPTAAIRMAASRGLMQDKGRLIFMSGANACITGDMLTTTGIHVDDDMSMLKQLAFEVRL